MRIIVVFDANSDLNYLTYYIDISYNNDRIIIAGGGGGYFGGAYYDTIDRFYSGSGGSGYIGGVTEGATTAGLNEGNGRAVITLLSY